MLAAFITLLLIGLLALGVPVAFALAVSGCVGLYELGGLSQMLGILDATPLSSVASYELITVPLFLFMAELVIMSGVADDLFRSATIWVGRVPGGLGIATALSGAGFGAISGSSTASAATLSATSIPAMLRAGYEPRLACGVVAISGTLAMLIPPSIALVLFGLIADVSIGALLIGGVIPGLLVTLTIALTILYLVWRDPSRAPAGRSCTMREKFLSLRVAGPMLVLLLAVTGVIYLGIATPTEAAAIGASGAFALTLWQRQLNCAKLRRALLNAANTTCMILMIIVGAKIFGYFLTLTQTTQFLIASVGAAHLNRWVVLAFIVAVYIVLGCLMDQIAILILTVPVVLPLVTALGFDPVWFGVVIIVVAEIGMVTPPVGLNVFVVARYSGRPLEEIFGGIWPHVFAHLVLVVLLCLFPALILWLPSTMR
jgi:tripartite ATP-independent transporter DctM subunit